MPTAPDLPSRFELLAPLGQGGMGAVWRVRDRERGEELALKTFEAEGEDGRFLFKQEFWAMASLGHPNLVAAYDYGETPAGTPYFTMELVGGQDVVPPQDEATVRAWLPGILAALGHLHGHGWLHGDLKPENLRVGADVKLMDLGLLRRAGEGAGPVRGTLAYVAPEAIRQGPLDGRADLYALGAVLFHVLTGRPPFEQADTLGLLRAHLDQAPPSARSLVPSLSPSFDAALRRLLAKDPGSRFPNVAALAEALELPLALETAQGLLAAPLVGREAELATLLGARGTYAVTGPSGSGRTRLLDALRAEAQLAGLETLAARGEGADAPPYASVRPWLRAIAAHRGPSFERLAPLVARIAPEVGVAPAPALEGAQERLRAHDALAALAHEAFPHPTLWLLDDAARLDAADQELLAGLRRVGADRPWTFVLSGEEAAPGPTELALPALDDAAVAKLAGYLLGLAPAELPAALLERLSTIAEGRPGPVTAALAHWLREGALVRTGGRWDVAPGATLEAPGDLADALVARIAALGEDARTVALAAARLGQPASLGWLAATLDLSEGAFFAGLAALRGAGVLATEGDRFRFLQPAVAEALAASWTDPRGFHTRAAAALQARVGEPTFDAMLALARHGLAGEDPLAAVPWAIAAARRATGLHAVGPADSVVTAALAVDGLSDADRAALLALLGYVRRFQGRVDEALAVYEEQLLPLLRQTPNAELVEHLVTWGVLLQLKGRYDDALAAHAQAVNLADEVGASRQAVRARLFAGRVGIFSGKGRMARTSLGAAVKRARALVAEDPSERSLLARSLSLLGYLEGTSGEPARVSAGLAMLDEAVAIDREIGDLRETHEALNNLGNVLQALGRYLQARDVFAECLALCERMASPNEAVFAHINLGGSLLELGRPAEAVAHAREAASVSGAQGRRFPQGCALVIEGPALVRLGQPGLGLARLEEAAEAATALGSKYLGLMVEAYRAVAYLDLGHWEGAAAAVAAGTALAEETGNQEYDTKLRRVEWALAVLHGEPGARERLANAAAKRDHDGPQAHALRWLAALHAAGGDWDAARKAAERGLALAQDLGLSRLEAELHGLLAGAPGDDASEHARQAAIVAETAGDVLGAAVAGAHLAKRRGDAAELRAATQRLEAIAAELPEPLQAGFWRDPARAALRDAPTGDGLSPARVRHLTALIAAMAEATDLRAVMDQALEGLIELAEAERGFLVLYDGFEERERLALAAPGHEGTTEDGYSTGIAQQVLWTGEPLFVEDASNHAELAGNASVQALSLRSVLGLPLRAGGQTIGVMLADSRTIGRGLSEAELALALALAQAVALAISHADRHDEAARERAVAAAVKELAIATAGVADPAEYARAALDVAIAATGAERGKLYVGAGESLEELQLLGAVPAADHADVSASVCRWVLEQRAPLHMVDVQSEEAFQSARSVMALGLRTVWAVPLQAESGPLGLIYLDSQRLGDDTAQGLAAVAAVAELTSAFLARIGTPS